MQDAGFFFTPKLQLCDLGFYGAGLELASKKVLRRAAGKRATAKEGPEYGRKKKMDVTGMLPVERSYRGKISISREHIRRKHLVKKRVVFALKGICLIVLLFAALFPVYWLVLMAIRPTAETSMGAGLIPHQITGEHFTELFVGKGFGTALKNSLINAVSALVMSLVLGLATAYIISRKRFRFGMKKPLTYWVLDPVDGTTNLIHDYRASVISLALMQEGSLLVANIAVVCSLFFFCNFPGGNGFRVFQQEHLLADRSSGGVHFNGMYACKKSSK